MQDQDRDHVYKIKTLDLNLCPRIKWESQYKHDKMKFMTLGLYIYIYIRVSDFVFAAPTQYSEYETEYEFVLKCLTSIVKGCHWKWHFLLLLLS